MCRPQVCATCGVSTVLTTAFVFKLHIQARAHARKIALHGTHAIVTVHAQYSFIFCTTIWRTYMSKYMHKITQTHIQTRTHSHPWTTDTRAINPLRIWLAGADSKFRNTTGTAILFWIAYSLFYPFFYLINVFGNMSYMYDNATQVITLDFAQMIPQSSTPLINNIKCPSAL